MALVVVTYLWGDKYDVGYVMKLRAGLKRHLKQEHRFVLITDRTVNFTEFETQIIPVEDRALLNVKGCFARLRLFDPTFQKRLRVQDIVVCLDLDAIMTGPLDPLFNTVESFKILTGANAANPVPYNGSVWLLRAGYRPDVWSDFSLEAAGKVPFYEFPDDQGWFAERLPGVVGWKAGPQSGVYAFKKPGWPADDDLPADARMVVFPGWRDPSKFAHLNWIGKHWRVH